MNAPIPARRLAPPQPTEVTVHEQSRVLEVAFDDGARFRLPFEFLRVMSPSAEVRGHGPGQETLQTGKREVRITGVTPVGHYALQPTFDDGHDSGLYTWEYLHEIGSHQEALWQQHLQALAAAGLDRDAPMGGTAAAPATGGGCGGGGGGGCGSGGCGSH